MYSHLNKVIIRTPLHPLSFVQRKIDLTTDDNDIFLAGIYLSSPELYHEWKKYEEKTDKKKEKLLLNLEKYWFRSCTRCTPYATFAGLALTDVNAEKTQLVLHNPVKHQKSVRPDMAYINLLYEKLSADSETVEQVTLFPNNSLYEVADEYRFVEYNIDSNGIRNYQLSEIEKDEYLEKILNVAKGGCKIKDLISTLKETEELFDIEEIRDYIFELLTARVLISELDPYVTGLPPIDYLIKKLEKIKTDGHILAVLQKVNTLFSSPLFGIEYLIKAEEALKSILPDSVHLKNIIQVDLYTSYIKCNVNEKILNKIIDQFNDLVCFSRAYSDSDLEAFKKDFLDRFEDKEIPLAFALDSDIGLGYAKDNHRTVTDGNFIQELFVKHNSYSQNITNDSLSNFITKKYSEYIESAIPCITISIEDIESLKGTIKQTAAPISTTISGSLFKMGENIDTDNFLFHFQHSGGSSGANVLGRFASGNIKIADFIKSIIKIEDTKDPDVILAEIVHIPQSRIGNVLLRPVLRKYEIPYVGSSGASKENQIDINDIMVSVRNNKILLRSKKFNKQIKPKLATAHNYKMPGLPVYKFLCDLQSQDFFSPISWDWGILDNFSYLPRVIYKNIILKRASWIISEQEMKDAPKQECDLIFFIEKFCLKRKIPKHVIIAGGDNELLIDFSNYRSILNFLNYFKKTKLLKVEEFLFNEENSVVFDNKELPYTNELIIPLVQKDASVKQAEYNFHNYDYKVKEQFFITEEWVYFKIYCGIKSAEHILLNSIAEFILNNSEVLFDKFFFVRYSDECGNHIRIRFHCQKDFTLAVLSKFMDAMKLEIAKKRISNIVLDTYKRETKRYNPELIDEAESFFHIDSSIVLKALQYKTDNDFRILFALSYIDNFLQIFGLSIDEKHTLLKQLRNSFFTEFGAEKFLQEQLNSLFQKWKPLISDLLLEQNKTEDYWKIKELITFSNPSLTKNVEKIIDKIKTDKGLLFDLIPSYLHMFMNRLFSNSQRKYELVVYSLLERYFYSMQARNKQTL